MLLKKIKHFDCPEEKHLILELSLGNPNPYVPENLDWEKFDRMTRINGLVPLIQLRTKNNDQFNHNPIIVKYKEEKRAYTARTFSQIQILVSIMADFRNNRINALSIKGPLLGMEVYGIPDLRYSVDLDILVEPERMETAKKRMIQMGFREWQREERVFDMSPKRSKVRELEKDKEEKHEVFIKNDMRVELHYEADTHWNAIFPTLWNKRREKTLLGKTIYCLDEYDNLAYLICHAAGHSFNRLNWLVEIAELFKKESIDYDVLYDNMVEKGVGELLLSTLILLYRIPAICLPDISNAYFTFTQTDNDIQIKYKKTIRREIRLGIKIADIVGRHLMSDIDRFTMTNKQYPYLLPRNGVRQRKSAYIKSLFQPCEADLNLVDLPDSLFFLYYIIRPFHKVWRIVTRRSSE